MRIAGKVALIAGGARGIGEAIVQRFVAEGAHVAICDNADTIGNKLADALGERARYIGLDLGSESSWQAAVARTEEIYGPLDILVNNVGMDVLGNAPNDAEYDFAAVTSRSLTGVYFGIRAALPSLRRGKGGVIVNLLPCMGTEACIGLAAYAAVAHGIHGVTRAAAVELGEHGIRANSVRPGLIRLAGINDDQQSGVGFGMIPLHREQDADRAGQPEDVANVVLFLASDESSYMTGMEFVVDGGLSQCRNATAGRAYDARRAAWG